jgi:hypothetical protein
VYDSHGNTTSLAGDTLGFDIGDRHVSTTTAAGASIAYVRDASDRLVTRTVSGSSNPDDNGTTYYAYSGDGDSADLILDAAGALAQRELSLPGGVLLTKTYGPSPSTSWAYPNIHADIIATADGAGACTGGEFQYDHYGKTLSPLRGEPQLATIRSYTSLEATNENVQAKLGWSQKCLNHSHGSSWSVVQR